MHVFFVESTFSTKFQCFDRSEHMANVIVYMPYIPCIPLAGLALLPETVMSHPVMANCLAIKQAFVARAMSTLNKPQMVPKHVPIHSTHRLEHRYINFFTVG